MGCGASKTIDAPPPASAPVKSAKPSSTQSKRPETPEEEALRIERQLNIVRILDDEIQEAIHSEYFAVKRARAMTDDAMFAEENAEAELNRIQNIKDKMTSYRKEINLLPIERRSVWDEHHADYTKRVSDIYSLWKSAKYDRSRRTGLFKDVTDERSLKKLAAGEGPSRVTGQSRSSGKYAGLVPDLQKARDNALHNGIAAESMMGGGRKKNKDDNILSELPKKPDVEGSYLDNDIDLGFDGEHTTNAATEAIATGKGDEKEWPADEAPVPTLEDIGVIIPPLFDDVDENNLL